MTICPQCGYERTNNDDSFVSFEECPKCGVFYEKWKPSTVLKSNEPIISIENDKKLADNILTIPRGIKITAMLLIVISGLQIVGTFLVMIKMMSKNGFSPGLIIPIMIIGSILPAMGLVSGVGLMSLKSWSLNKVLLFSKISIVYYGIGVVLGTLLENSSRESAIISIIVYGCALPLWSLYYLTRPHIGALFASK